MSARNKSPLRAGWARLSLALACIALPAAASAEAPQGYPAQPECDRACLEGFVTRYMDALVVRDATRLPWSRRVRFSENNVMLRVGDGSWHVADGEQTSSRLIFADPQTGQAGYFGVIEQRGQPAFLGLRLKVEDGKISEVETLVNQPDPDTPPSPAGGKPAAYRHYIQMSRILPVEQRTPRRRMIDLANGYFSTLQLNDGKLFTHFTDDCKRQENGYESAGNPAFDRPEGKLSCGDQFKTGTFIFDSAVRDRDYMVVDEERGLVLARATIDHGGELAMAKLADGTPIESWISKPGSLTMLELFHITAGKIDRIEVIHVDVPYKMPSVWKRDLD
ncbi:MAG TPA: hypothetical protein VNZ43_03090 [Sphingomonadaceae bacterium]|nr:hypothetical protein [Sphingomonadaceae bacterium]